MKGCRIQTTGKRSSAWGYTEIVCPGKSRNGVKENRNILLMLYKTACTLNDHLWNSSVMLRKFVKGRMNNLDIVALDFFLDVGYFLRTLIDQKNDKMHIRAVFEDRFGHILEKCGLTSLRRRYDHASLPFTDRA